MAGKTKPGPKGKVDAKVKAKVLKVLLKGGSLSDAAGMVGVTVRTLHNAKRADREFFIGVKKARKTGKVRLIARVTGAKDWRGPAWYLERTYGREFGRKERHEFSGPGGKPVEVSHTVSYADIAEEIRRVAAEGAARVGGRVPADN